MVKRHKCERVASLNCAHKAYIRNDYLQMEAETHRVTDTSVIDHFPSNRGSPVAPPQQFSSSTCSERKPLGINGERDYGRMPFLLPSQQ